LDDRLPVHPIPGPSASVGATAPVAASAVPSGVAVLPPVTAIVELAVIVAVLLLVDAIWPALEINNLQPSPYWIPVLLLSLQYGTPSGSLAAIVAIIAYFALVTLPEQGVVENEFAYRLHILAQPILWIAAAVLLGQLRMVQIATKQALTRRLGDLERDGRVLADYASRLRSRCDELEQTIAGRALSDGSPMLDALAMVRITGAGVAGPVERCIATAFPLAAVSVFLRRGSTFERVAEQGWPRDAPWLTTLTADHALTLAILSGRRHLTVLDAADEIALCGQGVAAVPILASTSDAVVGLVKIERVDARYVTLALPDALDVIARALEPWAVASTGRDHRHLEPASSGDLPPPARPRVASLVLVGGDEVAGEAKPLPIAVELIRPKALR
jgi:polysaccharide biosynthesis protein PelD